MMMQAHSLGVVVHHHGSVSVNKSLLCKIKLILQGKGRYLLLLKDLHSVPGCLDELYLKSVTGNKIGHTKLTVKSMEREWKREMLISCCEVILLECDLGTRFVI